MENESSKQFEYLLKQSDFFSHFLRNPPLVKSNSKRGRPRKSANHTAKVLGDRRHFQDVKEEDSEFRADDEDNAKPIIRFDASPTFIKNGTMRDYQVQGLNWMISLFKNNINGILADEMGLGKTLQTIALLGYMKHYMNIPSPHIVIVPKSTLSNWLAEFERWCPTLKVICLIGADRNPFIKSVLKPKNWDVCVTSYEMCLREKSALKKFDWRYLVIDEAHRIKNEKSLLSEILRTFRSTNRLLLTGTPLQNNLHELWALLNFLLPHVFHSSDLFDSWFNTNLCLGDMALVEKLHGVLKPFLLRRIKADVEKGILPKKEIKLFSGLTKMQREWYTKILLKDIDIINGAGTVEKMRLQNILMHLRKCTNHPYLFSGAEPGPPYTTDAHLVENSGKMVILDKLLPKLQEQGSRILLFSQMTRMLDILEDYCFWRKYNYCRLDGRTPHEERQLQINDFNAPNSDKFIFLLSTRAGGLGINLASADVVIIYDSDFNPQMDLQAMDRCHRIGQKKQVRVFRLILENTADEKIIERAEVKLHLDRLVIQQGRLIDGKKVQPTKDGMLAMIRHGAKHILSSKESEIKDEDIDIILQRGETKTADIMQKFQLMGESTLRTFTMNEGQSLYQFEGEDYREILKNNKENELIVLPRRNRTKRIALKPQDPKYENVKTLLDSIPYYQFYPERYYDLLKQTIYYKLKSKRNKPVINSYEGSEAMEVQRKIDSALPLTKEEEEEMDILKAQGFHTWNKTNFSKFITGCAMYGRSELDKIAKGMVGMKTLEEITEYAAVFWARYKELKDADQIIARIKRGEKQLIASIAKSKEQMKQYAYLKRALDAKMAMYENPLYQLQIPYKNKTHEIKEIEEDKAIICAFYGLKDDFSLKKLNQAMIKSPPFRHWYKLQRNETFLIRRLNYLMKLFTEEYRKTELLISSVKQEEIEEIIFIKEEKIEENTFIENGEMMEKTPIKKNDVVLNSGVRRPLSIKSEPSAKKRKF